MLAALVAVVAVAVAAVAAAAAAAVRLVAVVCMSAVHRRTHTLPVHASHFSACLWNI